MQIRMKDQLTADEALMLLEVANAEAASLRQQLDDAHQIIAHQAKLNDAAWENIGVLREALEAMMDYAGQPISHPAARLARAALAQGERHETV